MSALPLAHFGHWYVQLPFALPPLALIAYLALTSLRDRKRRRQKENETPQDEPGQRRPS